MARITLVSTSSAPQLWRVKVEFSSYGASTPSASPNPKPRASTAPKMLRSTAVVTTLFPFPYSRAAHCAREVSMCAGATMKEYTLSARCSKRDLRYYARRPVVTMSLMSSTMERLMKPL